MSEKNLVRVDPELETLIPGFLENRNNDLKLLRDAISRGAISEIKSIGHNLKGVGGGYGFDRITEIGAGLEEAAINDDRASIEKFIAEFEYYLARIEVTYQ